MLDAAENTRGMLKDVPSKAREHTVEISVYDKIVLPSHVSGRM